MNHTMTVVRVPAEFQQTGLRTEPAKIDQTREKDLVFSQQQPT
jgi:hypothetical protein